jgi:hypothetical protein
MCTGLEILAVAGSVGGSLLKGFSGSSAAKLNQKVANSNARILEKTAAVQRIGADLAVTRAGFEETRKRSEVERVIGAAKTYYASRSLDPTVGSPLLIAGITAAQGEVDAGIIRANGATERAERLGQVASTLGNAAASRWQAAQAEADSSTSLLSGVLGAGTALLGGLSKWPGLEMGGSVGGVIGAPMDIRPPAFQF